MSQIFISYSHQDKNYAHKLQEHLLKKGFEAWVDDRLEYGSLWVEEIERRLRSCQAFILLESPASKESKWVKKELLLAIKLNKPILPIVLSGEPRLEIIDLQCFDAANSRLPNKVFFQHLRQLIPIKSVDDVNSGEKEGITVQVSGDVTGNIVIGSGNTLSSAQTSSKKQVISEKTKILGEIKIWKEKVQIEAGKLWHKLFVSHYAKSSANKFPTVHFHFLRLKWAAFFLGIMIITTIGAAAFFYITPPITRFVRLSPSGNADGLYIDEKGITMSLIPGGYFTMGSEQGNNDETPVHVEKILFNYYMDVYEVSNAAYSKCADAGACSAPSRVSSSTQAFYYNNPTYKDYPVVNVTWEQAKAYCAWRGARLPTEAEWEHAARGTDARRYPWGNSPAPNEDLANYARGDTSAVWMFSRGKSPYGLFNMAGNVWEWVADWYANYPGNPSPSAEMKTRVIRGGSWQSGEETLRASYRLWKAPETALNAIGFRCARPAP